MHFWSLVASLSFDGYNSPHADTAACADHNADVVRHAVPSCRPAAAFIGSEAGLLLAQRWDLLADPMGQQ